MDSGKNGVCESVGDVIDSMEGPDGVEAVDSVDMEVVADTVEPPEVVAEVVAEVTVEVTVEVVTKGALEAAAGGVAEDVAENVVGVPGIVPPGALGPTIGADITSTAALSVEDAEATDASDEGREVVLCETTVSTGAVARGTKDFIEVMSSWMCISLVLHTEKKSLLSMYTANPAIVIRLRQSIASLDR